MCIVAIAWQAFEKMPLVILSNRDEFLNRPTLPAHQWQDLPIFAGRDELSGGTWLGYQPCQSGLEKSNSTRWATVLNFRDMVKATPEQASRGQLVTDYLTCDPSISPMDFAKQINLNDYAGFNFIIGDDKQAVLVNNRGYPPTSLHPGLHVFSNGQPEDEWFKNERLRTRIYQEVLPLIAQDVAQGFDKDIAHDVDKSDWKNWQEVAFKVLSDTLQADDDKLPNTGAPCHVEQALSSIFIEQGRLTNYGTRTQTLLIYDNQAGFNLITKEHASVDETDTNAY